MSQILFSLYEELNMLRYVRLAEDVLADSNVKLALCDDNGEVVWASEKHGYLEKFNSNCSPQLCAGYNDDGCSCEVETHGGANLVRFHLGILAEGSAGILVFYGFGETGREYIVERVVPSLANIAELIKTQLSNLYEVNVMAAELGESYDELCMLRASDDVAAEFNESRHILSNYIRNCAEHLRAEYAAIWIAAKREIYPGGIAFNEADSEILTMLKDLSETSFGMFKNGHESFGINDEDDELHSKIHLPADKKVLLVPVLNADGKPVGVISCVNPIGNRDFTSSDMSVLEAVSRKIYKYLQSTRDELTGLLNRKGLDESACREALQTGGTRYLVVFSINQFKVINAAYSMATGDRVLAKLADIISNPVYELKYIARLDADMFAAVVDMTGSSIEERVSNICNDIDSMSIIVSGKYLSIKSRAGVIAFTSKEKVFCDYMYAAELALSSAKEDGKQVVVYQPGNTALLKQKRQLTQVENIKVALQEDRFVLYCQRIQPLSDDELHYEILVRMLDDAGELVPPDEFIPVAERYNLMNSVDRWIIKHTFKLLCQEQYRDIATSCKWGINLSGVTIGDSDFREYVSQCLCEYNFQPTNLYFEITETAAIKNYQNCIAFMNDVHSMGVHFALDDFGSGMSSFSYLKKFSIDYLKIDGSLIKDIVNSELDVAMVAAIADIAKVLNVKTIAEYVENDLILEVLGNLGIDYAQGYGIMKPLPVEQELQNLAAGLNFKKYSAC